MTPDDLDLITVHEWATILHSAIAGPDKIAASAIAFGFPGDEP